ncbi:hypothetical protein [Mycobacterium sp.]|uniref:hypothetical protein n=1 Tax=Mycobacterium sp. TaxID=1785 RepID=UPI003BA8C5D5
MKTSKINEIVVGGVGGVAVGYVWWLVAISIGDGLTTVSRWSLMVLLLSGALAVCAAVGVVWLRRRGNYSWAAFALGLPILPVALTLAVLADIYF